MIHPFLILYSLILGHFLVVHLDGAGEWPFSFAMRALARLTSWRRFCCFVVIRVCARQ